MGEKTLKHIKNALVMLLILGDVFYQACLAGRADDAGAQKASALNNINLYYL